MVTLVSAAVFAVVLLGLWAWVGYERRHGHVKKRQQS